MPDEPGVGLEHVRMMPLEKRDPVPGGGGSKPWRAPRFGPHASEHRPRFEGLNHRALRRGAGGRFVVFRRFTGLLLGRPLRRGHIPPLGIQPRKSFISVKESVGDGIQLGDGGESNPRGSRGKGLFPG